MTANYKLDAVLEIRKFLWSKLVAAEIFDDNEYFSDSINDKMVPIVPVQQVPEMDHFLSGKKHIVYDKIGTSYEENWMVCCEQILFTIYSSDVSEINEIRNFMIDEFRRVDDSARDVNRFKNLSNKFKFFSIFVADISPTEPSEEMQGLMSSDVILEIKYARIVDEVGRFI